MTAQLGVLFDDAVDMAPHCVAVSRLNASLTALTQRFFDFGFGLEPVGHLVSGREAALFSAEIGGHRDHLFDWAIGVG